MEGIKQKQLGNKRQAEAMRQKQRREGHSLVRNVRNNRDSEKDAGIHTIDSKTCVQ